MKETILDKLFSLRRFGIQPGLERIQQILGKLGNPERKFPSIHIAGTNGKGSVSSILASILMEAGLKVGLYTSPHIFSFNERIKINGKPIGDDQLLPLLETLLEYGSENNSTFFEITTALAFKYFVEQKVDIAVVETGMGGRYDATNVVTPLVAILTKIDFDHQQYLGNTIEQIVWEKCGIVKPNVSAVIGRNNSEVYELIQKNVKGSKLIFAEKIVKIENFAVNPKFHSCCDLESIKYKLVNLEIPLLGNHQAENIATSIAAIELLNEIANITENNIREGLANIRKNTRLAGRFDVVQLNPPVIVDVAHNPNAISTTVRTIKDIFPNIAWNVIFTMMKDKDIEKSIQCLCEISNTICIPNLKFDRAEKNENILHLAKKALDDSNLAKIKLFDSANEALEYCVSSNLPTLIIGSFYLLNEVCEKLIEKYNWDFETIGRNYAV